MINNIYSLVIEVTRRCNMNCRHCLRGDAQNIDIPIEYVDKLFSQVDSISTITFSGGEPSLIPQKLIDILEIAKKYDVNIGNFYIVTNGKLVTPEFIYVVIQWYAYCDDNEISGIALSRDDYHENIPEHNLKILRSLKFFEERNLIPDPINNNWIREGRAQDFGIRQPDTCYNIEVYDCNIDIQEGDMYLNCKGNIVKSCDFSYKSQDDHDNILFHVNNIEKFIKEQIEIFDECEIND